MARANDEREQIRVDLSGLNAAIDVHAGDAVEEELADVTVRFEAAERGLEELEFEIAVFRNSGPPWMEHARALGIATSNPF